MKHDEPMPWMEDDQPDVVSGYADPRGPWYVPAPDSYETHLRELAQPPGTAFHDYLVDNPTTKMSLWDRICFWLLQKGFW